MDVEDAVLILNQYVNEGLFSIEHRDDWAASFVAGIASFVKADKALSTEQGRLFLRLLDRKRSWLREIGADTAAFDALIFLPRYRRAPYPSANIPREVRYLGDNFLGFRFKRNDTISNALKAMVRDQDFPFEDIWFHGAEKLWVVPVNRDTLPEIMEVIANNRFAYDDEVTAYLSEASEARGGRSSAATDVGIGLTAIQVRDDELTSWFLREIMQAQPV